MNTQAHILIQAALIRGKTRPQYLAPAIVGAVIPDFTMFIFFFVETFIFKTPQQVIWDVKYFLPDWQLSFNIFNSIPFIVILLLFGLFIPKKTEFTKSLAIWVVGISISMLLHAISDLLLHSSDGHAHFFPLSNFIFKSPVSYWEKAHFGLFASTVELIASVGACVFLYTYLKKLWSKIALILLTISQVLLYAGLLYFELH